MKPEQQTTDEWLQDYIMAPESIADLIARMKQKSNRHDRRQLFDWETRHLTTEQKRQVEQQVRERWNERVSRSVRGQ